jgi:3-phosphoshikimate 1-carboxyvinyltransferase
MNNLTTIPLSRPIKATVSIPGSKSYTNRALLMAAMTPKKVRIHHPLISDDTVAMMDCLKKMGIKLKQTQGSIDVLNDVSSIKNEDYDLNANLSGTTIRFMLAFACIVPGTKTLYGKEGLNKRPISELVDGLRQLGAEIEYMEKEGFPPLRITSSKLSPGTVKIDGSISSQYLSALLMISPLVGNLTIEVLGEQISKPYIDMTIDTLKQFGITISNKDYQSYAISADQQYRINEYIVEGDVSSASYFAAIATLTKSTITLQNINPESVQADMRFLSILKSMGSEILYGNNEITIVGKGVKPVAVDMENCPDQAQTLAVLASFANGVTKISGVQSLRVKETERVMAVEQELRGMGIRATSTLNSLTIHGGSPKPAKINTYGDHRMAMAFAVAGSLLSGVQIKNPEVVAKTFPDFWEKLHSIGVITMPSQKNIVLIGMRGSGKTTIAQLLSKKLKLKHLEMDELLIKKVGHSIPEIVEEHGWDYFRDQESVLVEEISTTNHSVISTGGGVVINTQNIERLKKNGIVVLLKASASTLAARIGDDSNRPALTTQKTLIAELEEVLTERRDLYEAAADIVINTETAQPIDVVDQILLEVSKKCV